MLDVGYRLLNLNYTSTSFGGTELKRNCICGVREQKKVQCH
jgi:hypothetical protein